MRGLLSCCLTSTEARWPIRDGRAGIKMEGLLYLEKYGIGGLEFARINERRIGIRKGRQLFHARA